MGAGFRNAQRKVVVTGISAQCFLRFLLNIDGTISKLWVLCNPPMDRYLGLFDALGVEQ